MITVSAAAWHLKSEYLDGYPVAADFCRYSLFVIPAVDSFQTAEPYDPVISLPRLAVATTELPLNAELSQRPIRKLATTAKFGTRYHAFR